MAKQRKTERVTEREEIEQLWGIVRALSVRVDALEDAAEVNEEYFSLTDASLDKMVAEAMAARPWYAKVGSWLKQGDNGLVVASLGVASAFIAVLVALFA